jgi:hypothetical protein
MQTALFCGIYAVNRYQGLVDTMVQLFASQPSGLIALRHPIQADCELQRTTEKEQCDFEKAYTPIAQKHLASSQN